jgi:hypothetical protein
MNPGVSNPHLLNSGSTWDRLRDQKGFEFSKLLVAQALLPVRLIRLFKVSGLLEL